MNSSNQTTQTSRLSRLCDFRILQSKMIKLEENQDCLKNNLEELLKLTKNLNCVINKNPTSINEEENIVQYSQYSHLSNDLEEKINLLQIENNCLKETIEQNNYEINNLKKEIETLETTVNVIKQLLKYI